MPSQQPSNRQLKDLIVKGLDEIREAQRQQRSDIDELQEWKKGTEIAKQAVAEYKRAEATEKEAKQRRELLKQAGIVLALITTVIYVYLSTKGIHP